MPKKLKKALDIASTVALSLFVLFVVLLVGVRLFGIEPHIVLSGSMEPEIMTGSLVYVKPISVEEAQSLKVGDTVTYLVDKSGTKVTHCIYEVVGPAYVKDQYGEFVLDANGEKTVAKDDKGQPIIMYLTYGINNKNEDEKSGYTLDGKEGEGNLASTNVFGKPVFSIPFLGYIANFVQNPPGQYIAIAGCALLVGLTLISGGEDEDKKKKKKKGGEEPEAEAAEAEDIPEDVETKLEELKREISELQARNEPEASEPRDGDASPPK